MRSLLEEIINCLAYENIAMLTLEYECLGIAQDLIAKIGIEEEREKVENFPNLVAEVGRELFKQLKQDSAYYGGHLAYQYHDCINNDVVLMHREYRPFGFAAEDIADYLSPTSAAWRY